MKSTDNIFRQAMVNGHFAADAAIMRKNRRRNLNESNASHVGCGNETRQIADNSAAKRDDR